MSKYIARDGTGDRATFGRPASQLDKDGATAAQPRVMISIVDCDIKVECSSHDAESASMSQPQYPPLSYPSISTKPT
jgi:hypothetical protein